MHFKWQWFCPGFCVFEKIGSDFVQVSVCLKINKDAIKTVAMHVTVSYSFSIF